MNHPYLFLIVMPKTNDFGEMYLATAMSETSIGFTDDVTEAWRFPSERTAQWVKDSLRLSACYVRELGARGAATASTGTKS